MSDQNERIAAMRQIAEVLNHILNQGVNPPTIGFVVAIFPVDDVSECYTVTSGAPPKAVAELLRGLAATIEEKGPIKLKRPNGVTHSNGVATINFPKAEHER